MVCGKNRYNKPVLQLQFTIWRLFLHFAKNISTFVGLYQHSQLPDCKIFNLAMLN
jgi:uncharacterized membrane protein YoaT (DUF817 family)